MNLHGVAPGDRDAFAKRVWALRQAAMQSTNTAYACAMGDQLDAGIARYLAGAAKRSPLVRQNALAALLEWSGPNDTALLARKTPEEELTSSNSVLNLTETVFRKSLEEAPFHGGVAIPIRNLRHLDGLRGKLGSAAADARIDAVAERQMVALGEGARRLGSHPRMLRPDARNSARTRAGRTSDLLGTGPRSGRPGCRAVPAARTAVAGGLCRRSPGKRLGPSGHGTGRRFDRANPRRVDRPREERQARRTSGGQGDNLAYRHGLQGGLCQARAPARVAVGVHGFRRQRGRGQVAWHRRCQWSGHRAGRFGLQRRARQRHAGSRAGRPDFRDLLRCGDERRREAYHRAELEFLLPRRRGVVPLRELRRGPRRPSPTGAGRSLPHPSRRRPADPGVRSRHGCDARGRRRCGAGLRRRPAAPDALRGGRARSGRARGRRDLCRRRVSCVAQDRGCFGCRRRGGGGRSRRA